MVQIAPPAPPVEARSTRNLNPRSAPAPASAADRAQPPLPRPWGEPRRGNLKGSLGNCLKAVTRLSGSTLDPAPVADVERKHASDRKLPALNSHVNIPEHDFIDESDGRVRHGPVSRGRAMRGLLRGLARARGGALADCARPVVTRPRRPPRPHGNCNVADGRVALAAQLRVRRRRPPEACPVLNAGLVVLRLWQLAAAGAPQPAAKQRGQQQTRRSTVGLAGRTAGPPEATGWQRPPGAHRRLVSVRQWEPADRSWSQRPVSAGSGAVILVVVLFGRSPPIRPMEQ